MKRFITELQDEVTSRLINNGVSEENINAVEEALENRTDHIVEMCIRDSRIIEVLTDEFLCSGSGGSSILQF